jgi:phosphoglycerate dehydrogenase-like enzyme
MQAAMVRILMSAEATARLSAEVAAAMASRPYRLVLPQDDDALLADAAFISRDVTGLSTKHDIQPSTQAFYDVLRAASALRWVQVHSAGADRPMYQELRERGVLLTTASGASAPVGAQSAVLGLLALARHWPRLIAAQREHRWSPLIASGLPRDLQGQTAVLVGWGRVGQEIARLLLAFGLHVVVVRRQAGAGAQGVSFVTTAELQTVLPSADWLLLACPLTPQTRGLIGAAELALLQPHAGLINISRGEVIDEPALIRALAARELAGAYLDVHAQEPLPPESPLWDLPNVIATPHSAGFSDGNERRVAAIFLENLRRWARGEPVINAVAPWR